ncbi:MAG: uracil-DNA glycosylase family protein [Rikenellaceae bacterium]|nr:uracil-DNA glycosylase family protein [Rikenellaceae bacterium]
MNPAAMQEDGRIEIHPLEPFLPKGATLLMLGSFPPPRARWSMEFYYPNLQNDMWRIFGLVFFGDREHFMELSREGGQNAKKVFSKDKLEDFLTRKGIALSDTASMVIRQRGNASDKFLEIVTPVDLGSLLGRIPECRYIVTTGDKATSTLASLTGAAEPPVGGCVDFHFGGRPLRHYRMPSSSRAYPLALEKKAGIYARMMREIGLL